jgi:ABC-type glycerol-3-phosphate transport system permease component
MNSSRRQQIPPGRALILAGLCGYALWVIFPMIWMAYSSLKPDEAIFQEPFTLPAADHLQFANYSHAWREAHFGEYFFNSVLVTTVSVAAIVLLGAMAGYALSRFYHPAGRAIFWLFLAGLTIPAQLAMVPLFFELRGLGLLNSRPGLMLVYTANGLPFAVFILSVFFKSLPRALYEAAVVDGCNEFSAFWHVLLPLAKPGLVTVAIFQFIGIWKEYFFAFLITNGGDGHARTLPLGLANLAITAQYHTDYGMLFAGLVLVTVPILIVYIALQKHLVKGITAGAIKG